MTRGPTRWRGVTAKSWSSTRPPPRQRRHRFGVARLYFLTADASVLLRAQQPLRQGDLRTHVTLPKARAAGRCRSAHWRSRPHPLCRQDGRTPPGEQLPRFSAARCHAGGGLTGPSGRCVPAIAPWRRCPDPNRSPLSARRRALKRTSRNGRCGGRRYDPGRCNIPRERRLMSETCDMMSETCNIIV